MLSFAYLFSFAVAVIILLYMITRGEGYSVNQILLITVIVIGSGGYYALSVSENLPQALLALQLIYVIGIFAPMMLFVNVCEIYKVSIPGWLLCIMYAVQFCIYGFVLTIGHSDLFYKSAQLNRSGEIVYLTKEYGPMHTAYVVSMYLYFALLILVSSGVIKRRRRISTLDVNAIFFLEFFTIAVYIAERMVGLKIELMPFIFEVAAALLMIPITKLNTFSLTGHNELIRSRLEKEGYIFIDKKLRFMGCNDRAYEFFPELKEWELEKKLPGKGGRFNTYLRQPLYKYIEQEEDDLFSGTFDLKDEKLIYRIGIIRSRSDQKQGYIIELDKVSTKE